MPESIQKQLSTILNDAMDKEGIGMEMVLETLAKVCDRNAETAEDSNFIVGWRITAKHLRDAKSMLSYNCPYP